MRYDTLIGRAPEIGRLRQLLDGARNGISSAIVVTGEPGIGKTALIAETARAATGFTVVRVQGVEPESQLPYAGLHRLLMPFLEGLPLLPAGQRDALRAIFGLARGPAPSSSLVGLASLTMLADAAAQAPLLCVIDDVHWLDAASLDVVGFLARRMLADRIVIMCSARQSAEPGTTLPALPRLALGGLTDRDALALIAVTAPGTDGLAARRILEAARGNPLALTELARQLAAGRTDGLWRPEPLPLSRQLEQHFSARALRLPAPARAFLVLAAADSSGEAALLWRAAARLGIERDSIPDCDLHDFLTFGDRVAFRHPLVRSAVYGAASPADLARAHDALGYVSDPVRDPDRRAWHRAAAATAPDEDIAGELETAAGRARDRGGHAAETALLVRSSELTPDPRVRARRLVAAAGAAVGAGDLTRVPAMLDRAEPALAEPVDRAQAQRIRAMVLDTTGRNRDVPLMLSRAARTLGPADARLARDTWFQAMHAAISAGQYANGSTAAEVARAALQAPSPPGDERLRDLLLRGLATRIAHGHAQAAPVLRQALSAPLSSIGISSVVGSEPLCLSLAALELWDFGNGRRLLTQMIADARRRGALPQLWHAQVALAHEQAWSGELDLAHSSFTAALQAARIVEQDPSWAIADHLRILRGRDNEAFAAVSTNAEAAANAGFALGPILGQAMLTVGWLSRGRYADALASAKMVYDSDPPGFGTHILPDLIEAAVRCGDRDTATAAFGRLTERAEAAGTAAASGLLVRCAALLTAGDEADASFAVAAGHLASAGMILDEARTHLLHGEWLRRRHRRTDALTQLRRAHDMFSSMGALRFADRAQIEIKAAGARAHRHPSSRQPDLTPQEEQVARLAAQGATNREIAAALYLSETTVAYHLQKAYRKLGITSRRQLMRRVAGPAVQGRSTPAAMGG